VPLYDTRDVERLLRGQLSSQAMSSDQRKELERLLMGNATTSVAYDPYTGRTTYQLDPYRTASSAADKKPDLVPASERERIANSDIANASLLLTTEKLRAMLVAGEKISFSWAIQDGMSSQEMRSVKSEAAKEALNAAKQVMLGCAINCAMAVIIEHRDTILDCGIFKPEEWVEIMIKAHEDGTLSVDVVPDAPTRAMRPVNPPEASTSIPMSHPLVGSYKPG